MAGDKQGSCEHMVSIRKIYSHNGDVTPLYEVGRCCLRCGFNIYTEEVRKIREDLEKERSK